MSRLDRQIALVQNKLLLDRFLRGTAWSLLFVATLAWGTLIVGRVLQVRLPREELALGLAAAAALIAGAVYALKRRPTPQQAAAAIDERLSLNEKFITALHVRPLTDPFARAALRDAESTAEKVSLRKRFPVQFPNRPAALLGGVCCLALLTALLLPNFDVLGVQARQQKKLEVARTERTRAERIVKQALAQIQAAPKSVADAESIKLARQDLSEMLKKPMEDPAAAQRKAEKALSEMESVRQQIKEQQKFAEAQNQMKALQAMDPAKDDDTPISQARNAMVKGDLSEAVDHLQSAVEKFDQMTQKDKEKTAASMQQLAKQMEQMANNPATQQQLQQQLQQLGATQQQAQQIQQLMRQAANGDQKAQEQIAQAAKALSQQANQKQGGSSQQQQQMADKVQQAIQKMQQQANAQNQAQQMNQAAQQLAQAMAQAAQQQQANGQQGKAGQQGQSSQGQQGSPQQQMAQAGKSMQQQLQQLQAMAKDAQAVAAGQQPGTGQPGNSPSSNQGNAQGQGRQPGGNQGGQWAQGNPKGPPGQGFGGPGQAAGARPDPEEAPFGVKQELSQSQRNENGKILASSFVKAGTVKGESKVGLADAVLQEQQDATDEVDEDRIPRSAAKAVKEYFQTIQQDAK